MPAVALAGYLVFFALAFGLRSFVHWRRTGRTGFVGLSGRVGSAEWWGGALFVVAIVAGYAAPVFQLAGVVAPWPALDGPAAHALGLVAFLAGVVGTLWSQFAMGDSWRIGVDESARTSLVARGPFRWVRNPIFSCMLSATVGLVLLAPNTLAVAALMALVVGLEIHVRFVEEPYLTRVHGDRYTSYAAQTGRFVPGVGRRSWSA